MTEFLGYPRPDGTYGVRNYVLVLSTVGCANGTVRQIAAQVPGAVGVENVKGCGQIGKGIEIMKRCLENLPRNPNVYGTLIVGLGCESTKPYELADKVRSVSPKPLEVLTIQDEGGTDACVEKGVEIARRMVEEAQKVERVAVPISELMLATNCGGSDATSGLAANPSLGSCSDRIAREGGTVLLGETTELIGTEHILAARAKDEKVAHDVLMIINDLEQQFIDNDIDVRGANPTPGNMKGGLSTLEEKALGSMQKGGTSAVNEVIPYGCVPTEHGLVIMDTPGYDIESVSGMTCAGAQVCIFTSGRGTPVGSALVPMIKLTGNHQTFEKMESNIDIDTSPVIDGTCSVDEMGDRIFDELIEVCNGKRTKAEEHGFEDFAIYHNQEIWCYCEP
ncbi:UxaA family hydrolase [Enorma burkinafasonensis]|uniref:UxaA family hydrolase n=1 Tax=Enorma burkinafasonensis TaxID=2590867 RepID=UPI0011A5F2E5|nr:UxaA family hydrolase [Enorma burkinafasonensis]